MERNPLERSSYPQAPHSITFVACSLFLLVTLTSAGLQEQGCAVALPVGLGARVGTSCSGRNAAVPVAEQHAQIAAWREQTAGRAQTLCACCWEMLGKGSGGQQDLLEGRSRKEPGGLRSALVTLRAEGDSLSWGEKWLQVTVIIMLSDITDEPFAKSEQRGPFSEHRDMHRGP